MQASRPSRFLDNTDLDCTRFWTLKGESAKVPPVTHCCTNIPAKPGDWDRPRIRPFFEHTPHFCLQ